MPTETLQTPSNNVKKPKTKKSVKFSQVDVYSFTRTQGFVSIPSDEDKTSITLGMAFNHTECENFNTIDDFMVHKRKDHLTRLELEAKNEENELKSYDLINEFLDTPDKASSAMNDSAMEEKYKIISVVNNKDMFENIDVDLPVNMEIFCPILTPEERRKKLEECGVAEPIDETESGEINEIKKSRLVCGCRCKEMDMICGENGDLCSCFANGISCQLDKIKYPCSCSIKRCKNPFGMKRFDAKGVIKHLQDVLGQQNSTEMNVSPPEMKENPSEETTRQIVPTPKRRKRKRNASYGFGSPKRKKKSKLTTPTRQEFVKSIGDNGDANSLLANISNISNSSINTSQL